MESNVLVIILALVSVGLFFLLRGLMCWYYKINQRVKLQKMQIEVSYRILEKLGGEVNWENIYNALGDKNENK